MIVNQYSREEKIAYVQEFKSSGMSANEYSREKGIPQTTFRGWLRLDRALAFGEIDLSNGIEQAPKIAIPIRKAMVFAKDDIRIELKEGYDKELLRNIVEVLINAN